MSSLEAPSPRFSLRRGSAPPPLSSTQSSLLQQHHRTYLQQGGGSNSNIMHDNAPTAPAPTTSSSKSGPLGLLSHLVGKRKSSTASTSSASQQPALQNSYESQNNEDMVGTGGGGVMILKVLNEEETGDESSSMGGDGPANTGGNNSGNNNAMVAAFATGVGGMGEDDGNATVEVAIPEEGGPGATAMLNLDSVKDLLRCSSCRRFLFPPILQCSSGHMQCRPCLSNGRTKCAKCQREVLEVPARLAEAVAEQFRVRCSYADKGCPETIQFKHRRQHEEVCQFKPVQCPEFDCVVTKPMNEIFRHFRLEHHHHFVNAHGNIFNGDIRCDDVNMIMGVERKWAPTMLKLEGGGAPTTTATTTNGNSNEAGEEEDTEQPPQQQQQQQQHSSPGLNSFPVSQQQHFFLEILRTKHGVWHMWVWYLGEAAEAAMFKCDIAIRKRGKGGVDSGDLELKYSGKVHSIRVPPHRVILSGCLLSFSDYTAAQFRYLGEGHQGHPVIDYRVSVSHARKQSSSGERAMAAGLTKMLRRFSTDVSGAGKANRASAASAVMATTAE